MQLNLLDRVGDWNAQLFREIKGRLNVRNVALTVAISLLSQLLLLFYGWPQIHITTEPFDPALEWQYLCSKFFASLSMFVLFALLVVGTYMLISDLAREERRGTLNFIRLSPQSTQSILPSKMLGVPILLYLAVVLTIPLQLGLGLLAQIPLLEIISFWVVLVASCAFFYSGALLFSLLSSGLSGFQSWLGSGAVLAFLWVANSTGINQTPADWLILFCPSINFRFSDAGLQEWEWFHLPLGTTGISIVIFALLNYGLWTYWIWQALKRRFHNPNGAILSKQQSYLLSACFTLVSLGFVVQSPQEGYSTKFFDNFSVLLSLNLLLLVGVIAALSPHRQALLDWARYRREKSSSLIQDLISGEKSPAVMAIAINLAITFTPMVVWILCWHGESNGFRRIQLILGLVLILHLILIYATLTQLMLLMKTNQRAICAAATVVTTSLLPPYILILMSIYPGQNGGGLWLLTAYPWDALRSASATLVVQALFGQWSILGLLSWQLTRQLRRIGESESKALFAGRPRI